MKIMVFTEGTVLMHVSGQNMSREERVSQVKRGDSSVKAYRNYIPNGKAVEKIEKWKGQGAEIYYLTSRDTPEEIQDIKSVLDKYKFPDKNNLFFREGHEEYKDVAEKLMPDILIEDNCESIGGESEMTYPHIDSKKKKLIKSIIVKEFAGIDDLPDNLADLCLLS